MAAEPSLPSGFGTRPWLVQGTRGERQTFIDSSDGSSHSTVVPEMQGKTCLGCIYGGDWLLMLDESTAECFLLRLSVDDDQRKEIPLPPLQEPLESIQTCASLEASPAQPDCVVVVSIKHEVEYTVDRFLLHCRPGDQHWTKLESPSLDFPNLMISHRGQIYYFGSSDTLMVIGDDGEDGTVRARRIGTLGGAKEEHDRGPVYYIVESCGDLFALVIESFGVFAQDATPTGIVVYRLDLECMMWRRVHSIGDDRAFLVSGNYGYSVHVGPGAGGLVPQGNCVYLVLSSCDCERLYKFCLDDMTVSFCQILPQPTEPWCRAFWAVPPLATVVKETELLNTGRLVPEEVCQSILSLEEEEEDEEEQATASNIGPWQDLPLDLLELVISKLSLVDRLRFPAVCKPWSMVSNPVEQAKVWPWLMHYSGRDGVCKLLDPLRCKEYTIRVETFADYEDEHDEHIFRFSKDGWVAVSANTDIDDIYLINPFTWDVVEDVAMFEWRYNYTGMSWSSVDPKSPDCVFFGVSSRQDGKEIGVHTWLHGQVGWTERAHEYYEGVPFPVAYANPVLLHGKFYCLGRKGNLATFDPTSHTWTILEKPKPIHEEMDVWGDDHEGREFCYLVEVGGELVTVFMCNADEPPRVFKLNEEMLWIEVQDIGGAALFLDFRVSYSVVSPEPGHGNRIYFPRYSEDGKQAAFYDMETKMYRPSFYGLKQPLQCVWVVPNLRPHI